MTANAQSAGLLDAELLGPSGALLATQIALKAAIDNGAAASTGYDSTTLDLLVRLDLAPNQQLRAVELCGQLQLSPSHISRMLDRAEAGGLIARGPDPGDRRAKAVTLTSTGRKAVGKFAPLLHAVLDRTIHQTLDRDEITRLVSYLERIEDAAQNCNTDHS